MSDSQISLSNHFLIAMPSMTDPMFAGAVIFLCDHSAKGALGLVINKPTDVSVRDLFERLEIDIDREDVKSLPVMFGGPVQTENGFVLHRKSENYKSSMAVNEGMEMTTSRDVLEHIAGGNGPSQALITLGYAGWGAGQLENELANNGWLNVEADESIIFDTPIAERLTAAMKLLGVEPHRLSSAVGHA